MSDSRISKYDRPLGARRGQKIILSVNDDGSYSVVVFDTAYATVRSHKFPSYPTKEELEKVLHEELGCSCIVKK